MFIFVLLSNSKEFKHNNQNNKYASYNPIVDETTMMILFTLSLSVS